MASASAEDRLQRKQRRELDDVGVVLVSALEEAIWKHRSRCLLKARMVIICINWMVTYLR